MLILFHYWSLPILFLLHDFEEMIFMPLWKKRTKFISLKETKIGSFFGKVTDGSAFSVGVLEEFTVLLLVSAFCELNHNSRLYLSFCIAYMLHFIMHYTMCFRFKGYVPGVVTVTVQLPVMLLLISHYWTMDWLTLTYFGAAMLIAYTNLYVMHHIMPHIQRILARYAQG